MAIDLCLSLFHIFTVVSLAESQINMPLLGILSIDILTPIIDDTEQGLGTQIFQNIVHSSLEKLENLEGRGYENDYQPMISPS